MMQLFLSLPLYTIIVSDTDAILYFGVTISIPPPWQSLHFQVRYVTSTYILCLAHDIQR